MPQDSAIKAERLEAGVIHVTGSLPAGDEIAVAVELVHCGQVLATAEANLGAARTYRAAVALPAGSISDGVQTYTLRLRHAPDVLCHFTIIAGAVLNTDLHAELDQLRAEVELLKKAFRRHCAQTERKIIP